MIQAKGKWSDENGVYFDWEYPTVLADVVDNWDANANARLIAAAPDLLEALEAVADYWAGGDVPEALDTQMRAAIAKARG